MRTTHLVAGIFVLGVGGILLLPSLLGLFYFLFLFDTAPNGIHNLGLLQTKQLWATSCLVFSVLGFLSCLSGTAIVIIGMTGKRQNITERKIDGRGSITNRFGGGV